MKRLLLLACLLLPGCAATSVPTIIPTGNPITDLLVNTALVEVARPIIANEAQALLGGTTSLVALLPGAQSECRRGRSGVLYCGKW